MATYLGFTGTLSGSTITVTPGNYGGVFMTNNTFTTPITIDGKGSTFSGSIYLPDTLSDVTFTNFTFNNAKSQCFRWANDNVSIGLKNIKFINMVANNCDTFATIGTWTDISKQTGMSTGLEFANIVVNNSVYNNVFTLSKCYGTKFHDVNINTAGSAAIDDKSHEGIIFIKWSDGEYYNNTIVNGGGNGFRVFPAGLGTSRGVINIHDNYIHDMRKHCAIESNGNETPDGYGGDITISYNTFGNLAKGTYESAGVSMYRGKISKTYVSNNITYNTSKGSIYSGDGTLPDSNVNNPYFATVDLAKIDTKTGSALSTSPAYGAGDGGKSAVIIPPVVTKTVLLSVTLPDKKGFYLYTDGTYEIK